jgi:uncharacterized protein YndB with AHSA1/START domain
MKMHVEEPSASEATIVMTRVFDAPRDVVWEALTNPKHVANWFGGHGYTSPICEMDVRPGGHWRHTMRTPDGMEFPMAYVYVEVVKPERLSWRTADTDPSSCVPRVTQTVTLEAMGKQTKWRLVARFGSIAERDAAAKMGFAEMVTQGCERFNDIVKAMA